jgi:DNA polymerase I-like protein with 3'-5' exonuclease and polymerase domains
MSKPIYAFDLEADGLRDLIVKKGQLISREATVVHCLVLIDEKTKKVYRYRGANVIKGWRRLMKARLIYGHNVIDYDLPVLRRLVAPPDHRVEDEPPVMDTAVMSRALYPDRGSHPNRKLHKYPNSLEAWGRKLGTYKTEFKGSWEVWSKEMEDYCVQDVRVTVQIRKHLTPKMRKFPSISKIEHRVAHIIARQCVNGVSFDQSEAEKFQRSLTEIQADLFDEVAKVFPPKREEMKTPQWWEYGEHRAETKKALGDKLAEAGIPKARTKKATRGPNKFKLIVFNPGSDDQVAAALIDRYGWKPTKITKGGKPSIKEEVLAALDYPEAALINHWRMVDKRLKMLRDWMVRAEESYDGRIHHGVNTCGTPTARMTHSQPNITQVTKVQRDDDGTLRGYAGRYGYESRMLFGPREDWVQVGGDASGLELRMLANRTFPHDDGMYADVILNGDIHTFNMEASSELQTRPQAKETFYAGLYGAGDAKQGRTIKHHKSLSPEQAKLYEGRSATTIGKAYKEKMVKDLPALAKVINRCKQACHQRGYLILLDGRRAPIRSEHLSLNTQLQGDGAAVMKLALLLHDAKMQRAKLRPGVDYEYMINAHDEFQLECKQQYAEDIGQMLVDAIVLSGKKLKVRCPLDGEFKIGRNWAECH